MSENKYPQPIIDFYNTYRESIIKESHGTLKCPEEWEDLYPTYRLAWQTFYNHLKGSRI